MFSILEPAAKANGRSVGWPVGPLHLSCPARQRSLTVDVLSFECIASCCQAHNKTPALGGGLSGGQSSLLGLRDVNLLQPCHQAIHNEVSGRNCSVSNHSPALIKVNALEKIRFAPQRSAMSNEERNRRRKGGRKEGKKKRGEVLTLIICHSIPLQPFIHGGCSGISLFLAGIGQSCSISRLNA